MSNRVLLRIASVECLELEWSGNEKRAKQRKKEEGEVGRRETGKGRQEGREEMSLKASVVTPDHPEKE